MRRGPRAGRAWPALIVAVLATTAFAADVPVRKLGIEFKEDRLLVSFGYSDIFDDQSKAKLTNGLPTTVLMRMSLVPKGKKDVLGFTMRSVSITYDLWDEVFHVTVEEPGVKKKKLLVDDASEAVKIAAKVKDQPISIMDVPSGTFRLHVRVDLNPVSKEVLKGMQSWLNRPGDDSGSLRPGDSFFGSFISFFVNKKLQKAERTREFKSQSFQI